MNDFLRKALLLICILVFFSFKATAQYESPHEYSFWGSVGASSLGMTTNKVNTKNDVGFGFGAGYSYHLGYQWSFLTGLEFTQQSGTINAYNLQDKYVTNMHNEELGKHSITYGYQMDYHKEDVTNSLISIPLMMQFVTDNSLHKFQTAMGVKIGVPVSSSSKSVANHFQSAYIMPNGDTFINPRELIPGKSNSIDFKFAFTLTAEAGMKWAIAEDVSLYTSAFVDYTPTNVLKNKNRKFIRPTPADPKVSIANSLVNSSFVEKDAYGQDVNVPYIKDSKPFMVGMKIRIGFSTGINRYYNRMKTKTRIRDVIMHPEVIEGLFKDADVKSIQNQIEEKERKTMNVKMRDLIEKH